MTINRTFTTGKLKKKNKTPPQQLKHREVEEYLKPLFPPFCLTLNQPDFSSISCLSPGLLLSPWALSVSAVTSCVGSGPLASSLPGLTLLSSLSFFFFPFSTLYFTEMYVFSNSITGLYQWNCTSNPNIVLWVVSKTPMPPNFFLQHSKYCWRTWEDSEGKMSFGSSKDILMDIFLGKGGGGQIIILS